MAQKPNFLKRLISKRLIKTISTAAFIAAASSSAMGAGVQKTVNVPTASFGIAESIKILTLNFWNALL